MRKWLRYHKQITNTNRFKPNRPFQSHVNCGSQKWYPPQFKERFNVPTLSPRTWNWSQRSRPFLEASRRYRSWLSKIRFEQKHTSHKGGRAPPPPSSVVIELPLKINKHIQLYRPTKVPIKNQLHYQTCEHHAEPSTGDMIHTTTKIRSLMFSKWCYKVAEPTPLIDRKRKWPNWNESYSIWIGTLKEEKKKSQNEKGR